MKVEMIDSHVHLWDPINTPRAVSFLNKTLGFNHQLVDGVAQIIFPRKVRQFFGSSRYITRPYLLNDYAKDCESYNIKGIVHIEAGWKGRGAFGPVGETKWLKEINTDSTPKILAIIVNADLGRGSKTDSLIQAHLDTSKLVKGVRETVSWQPNKKILNGFGGPNRISDANWRKGFENLSKFDLSFEATVYHNQLDELSELAHAYPDQKIMLSHLGTPIAVAGEFGGNGKSKLQCTQIFSSWQDKISRLAENPNVYVKLSGLSMPICGFQWHSREHSPAINEVAEAFAPCIRHVIRAFGPDRCLFGSNYPIDKVSLPLKTIIDAYSIILHDLSATERNRIFFQNAIDFYRIKPEDL